MIALADFVKYVRSSAPSCPDKIIKDAVREASVEFCERSKLITEITTVDTVIGQSDYPIAPTTGAFNEIQKCERADGSDLDSVSIQDFYEYDVDDNDPLRFAFLSDDLLLHPTPIAIETLTITGIVKPAEDDTTVPDELFLNHRQTIAAGAKHIIHSQYESYLDSGKATFNKGVFDGGVFKAGVKRAKGGTSRPLRTRSRFQ